VQIIESTDYAVRTAVLRLHHRGTPLEFLLYPMLHVGKPEFYQEITERLSHADVIVAEGIGAAESRDRDKDRDKADPTEPESEPENFSIAAAILTSGYRALTKDDQLGLVEQDIDYEALGIPIIYPDFSPKQFDQRFSTISLWERGKIFAQIGSLVAIQRLLGSGLLRFQLEHATMDDLPSLGEIFAPDAVENLNRVLIRERDKPLTRALDALYAERGTEPITVAVVYGAMHMRAVLKHLRPLGFRVVAGEWVTITDWT